MSKIKRRALALLASAALALGLTGCGMYDDWNEWASDCIAAGGHPSPAHLGNGENRYECFQDDAIVQVPGWEGQ